MKLITQQFQSHYSYEHRLDRIKDKEQTAMFCLMPLRNTVHNTQASVYQNVCTAVQHNFSTRFHLYNTHMRYITTV